MSRCQMTKPFRVFLVAFAFALAVVRNAVGQSNAVVPAKANAVSTAQAGSKPATASANLEIKLPLEQHSIRFAVIGDSGTGDREQYEVAQRMEAYRQATGFDFVIMLGDNI